MKKSKVLRIGIGIVAVCVALMADLRFGGVLRGWVNVFKGSEDYYRNYHAKGIRDGIDQSIADELQKKPPSGFLTKGYSREVWDVFWNDWIHTLYKFEEDSGEGSAREHYCGPTGAEFIQYIIKTRREKGLPEISTEERNRSIFEEIENGQ